MTKYVTTEDSVMKLPIKYSEAHWTIRKQAREEYVKMQNGKCHYCGGDLSKPPIKTFKVDKRRFPKNFFRWPIHLHHCHNTDLTIGAVHAHCNAVLWQYHGE